MLYGIVVLGSFIVQTETEAVTAFDFQLELHILFQFHFKQASAAIRGTEQPATVPFGDNDLFQREDLKERWEMNSRQSVHQVATRPDFPAPILTFNHGKTLLYLETEIQIFEVTHPWLITMSARLSYSHWILHNVIN